jgi:chromosomal replication initiation ATPase DnaA
MSPLPAGYRFETLVVGASNRTAATAARAVAGAPGASYNPLFLYSQPGLGKTHLLVSVGHQVREQNPLAQVEYLTADEFVESFHAAVAAGQADAYRARFAGTDVLLLDDVQFLSQRREMQAELLRLLDHLQSRGRQVVLTSDRPPGEIDMLDDRLLSTIAGGLVIDIAPPDYETQVAILRRKAEEKQTAFLPGVLEAVARLGIASVRELIGALNRLVAFQAVSEVPLDAMRARVLLGGEDEGAVEVPDLEHTEVAVPAAARASSEAIPGVMLGQSEMLGGHANSEFERADDGWALDGGEGTEADQAAADHTGADGAATSDERRATSNTPRDDLRQLDKPSVAAPRDEFGDFLSDLAETLSRQVEPWRTRIGEAILRWEGEGFRVGGLERMLEEQEPKNPEAVLIQYEADAERLLELRSEAEQLAPDLAGAPQLHDPANMQAAEAWMRRLRESVVPPSGPLASWALEALIEGQGNRMALTAVATAVAEPGVRYNPLVVVGGSGVGKTHLLHGFGNALAAAGVSPVACVSAHDFTQELIDAIDRDNVPAWRHRYRRVAALLMDDVHLLAGKDRSQEELFLLFNLFLESNRQLAFASGVPLSGLSGVEPRLLTRLEGGLVVELPPPDRDLRQALVERMLAERGLPADVELVGYLAARPADSARTVQGTVQRVLNAADAAGARPTVVVARDVVDGNQSSARKAAPRPLSPPAGVNASLIRSREKMVWDWGLPSDRVIEDWR